MTVWIMYAKIQGDVMHGIKIVQLTVLLSFLMHACIYMCSSKLYGQIL